MCRRSDDEKDCLYGVPSVLIADKGSAGRSGPAQNFFAALGIKVITHAVGNPRAKGQVEQAQNLVETQFEGRLRMYNVRTLPALNSAADEWRIHFAQQPSTGVPRFNVQ
jgi:transposase